MERARKYEQSHGLACVGDDVALDVLDRWEAVLTGLEADPVTVASTVDWVAKQRLVDGYAARHGIEPGAARLKAIDLQYHDLRADRCLALRAGLETIVGVDEVTAAMTEPPTTTRAYFRGRCLTKFPDEVVAANWDSLVFDVGLRPAPAGPDDGTTARYRRTRCYVDRRERHRTGTPRSPRTMTHPHDH